MRLRLLFLLLCLAPSCCGEQFWEKKPYRQWSKDQVQQIMRDSPWAKSTTLGAVAVDVSERGMRSSSPGALNLDRSTTPMITYLVQLRSAQPMRWAVARQSQLANSYDDVPAERKASIDERVGRYLAQTFPDTVVVYVIFETNTPNYEMELRKYWRRQDVAQLRSSVYLSAGGEKLALTGFVAGENHEFQFVFPRPKTVPPNGSLSIEFVHPDIDPLNNPSNDVQTPTRSRNSAVQPTGGIGESRLQFGFKLKDMTVKGIPEF